MIEPREMPHPKGYICRRAAEVVTIDGRLDKPVWQSAPWTDYFVDIEGHARPMPRFRSHAKMMWDDRYFYIGAELEDPHVWATLTEHDLVIFQDNDFEVFIDPDGDNHNYFEIEINALNTVWDLRLPKPYRDGGPALNDWEIPGLMSAVHVDGTLNNPNDLDRGWAVELALPWAAFAEFAGCATPPRCGDRWRVNFSRVEWHADIADGHYVKRPGVPEDNWVWSPQGVVDMHRPEHWGYVQFAEAGGHAPDLVLDPAWPARQSLHRVYYAQRRWHETHGRYAGSLAELGLASLAGEVTLHFHRFDFRADAAAIYPDGSRHVWSICEDSRVFEAG